jgi:hypothetical protein
MMKKVKTTEQLALRLGKAIGILEKYIQDEFRDRSLDELTTNFLKLQEVKYELREAISYFEEEKVEEVIS